METSTTPTTACLNCTGTPTYRVQLAGYPDPVDNFDQLVDHVPHMFIASPVLIATAQARDGRSITVWRLADADQGGDWSEDTVIAYAGPHPSPDVPGRTWIKDMSGHGFFEEASEASCEGHESLSGAHMGETVFCDGSYQAAFR